MLVKAVLATVLLVITLRLARAGEMKHNEIDSSRACACTWTTIADYEGRLQHSRNTRELMKRLLNQDGVDHDRLKTVERVARRLAAALPAQRARPWKTFEDDDDQNVAAAPFYRPTRSLYGYPYTLGLQSAGSSLTRADLEDAVRRVLREESANAAEEEG